MSLKVWVFWEVDGRTTLGMVVSRKTGKDRNGLGKTGMDLERPEWTWRCPGKTVQPAFLTKCQIEPY